MSSYQYKDRLVKENTILFLRWESHTWKEHLYIETWLAWINQDPTLYIPGLQRNMGYIN